MPEFEGQAAEESWSRATGGELARAVASKEFCGKLYEVFFAPVSDRSYRTGRLAAVGLGPAADFTMDRVRRAATAVNDVTDCRVALNANRQPIVDGYEGVPLEDFNELKRSLRFLEAVQGR